MRRSPEKPQRLLPLIVTCLVVAALACTDWVSGPEHDSHEFSRDVRAEATVTAVMAGSIELNTPTGRYYSPTSRVSARITANRKGGFEITTSRLSDPAESESVSPRVAPPIEVPQPSARSVGSDTTVATVRTINGKKHRVFITAARRDKRQERTRPLRVVRFVDNKLVDAMELVETRVGDRWVVTKGRLTFFDSAEQKEKATVRFELSDVQAASAKSRVMRQASDVLYALGSTFLPTPLHAEDDTSLDGPCVQMFLTATGLSAEATAAMIAYAGIQALAAMGDGTAIANQEAYRIAMVNAMALASVAWSAYREACGGGGPPPTDSTITSGGGGGSGQVMCYYWIFYEIDTGNIVRVEPLGCW